VGGAGLLLHLLLHWFRVVSLSFDGGSES
jgi:hypothetical protein